MRETFDPAQAAPLVDAVMRSRHSVRAFLPTPVPEATVREILEVASRAPSGTNMQPWHAYAVAGEKREALSRAVLAAFDSRSPDYKAEYDYYPAEFPEPYLSRRRKVGWDLYGLVGIAKGDKERMHAQHGRNYRFFDAPVGLIFTIDRRLRIGSWLDYGMFLENVILAARARGLHTCSLAAFALFHEVTREVLQIPEHHIIVCGMALGHGDMAAPVNTLVTERVPVDDFARFEGFGT